MRTLWLCLFALALLFVASVCQAAPRKCTFTDTIKRGFYLTAGFRWDKTCPECPRDPCQPIEQPTGNHDPAFIGAMLHYPLGPGLLLGGNFDRDLSELPDWNARLYIAFKPW